MTLSQKDQKLPVISTRPQAVGVVGQQLRCHEESLLEGRGQHPWARTPTPSCT